MNRTMPDTMRLVDFLSRRRGARSSHVRSAVLESLERRYLWSITGVSGNFSEGLVVTLKGASFGSVGPDIVVFDDFESGPTDELIVPGPATVGAWTAMERDIRYSKSTSVSGVQSARANMADHFRNFVEARLPDGTTDVFVSYSAKIPSGTRWPGEGTSAGINWKTVWLMGHEIDDDDRTLPSHLGGVTDPTEHNLHANNAPPASAPGFSSAIKRGEWLHTLAWVKGRTDNTGALQLSEVTASGVVERKNLAGIPTLYPGPPSTPQSHTQPYSVFERIRMNGYGNEASNCFPTFDDFYVAVGPGARARVEIGNAPTYEACSVLAITTPASWTDTEIRTTVRQGAFRAGQAAYVFVVSANGVASSGYPVTIGGQTSAVSQAFVGSTAWTPGFRNYLQAQGTGSRDYGFSVPMLGASGQPLPWSNVNKISLRFNKDVQVVPGDLTVHGLNVANYPVVGATYDGATHVATWTLGRNVGNDRLTVSLNSNVTGSAFVLPFEFLPGDTDRSGSVLANDFSDVKRKFFRTTTNPGAGSAAYSAFHDVNGSGAILADDFSEVKKRFFNTLPTAAPAATLSVPRLARVRPLARDLFGTAPVLGN